MDEPSCTASNSCWHLARAVRLKDVDQLLDLLKKYEIDAVLLRPSTPAAKLLDHIGGWQRAYADELAVLHVRSEQLSSGPAMTGRNQSLDLLRGLAVLLDGRRALLAGGDEHCSRSAIAW